MGSKTGRGVSPGQSRAMTGAATGKGSISGMDQRVAKNIERLASRAAEKFKPEFQNLNPEMVNLIQQSNPNRYGNPSNPFPGPILANAPGGRPLLSNAPGGYPDPYQPFNLNILPPSYLNPERLETYPGYIPRDPILPDTAPPGLEPFFEEQTNIPPSLRTNEIPTQNLPGGQIPTQNLPGGQIDQRNINPGFPVLRPGDLDNYRDLLQEGILSLLNRR